LADTAALAALDFRPIANSLREEVVRYYRSRGEGLSGPAGDRTLETNSSLVESRGGLLLHILEQAGGPRSVEGLRVVDLGCGLGALSVFFAAHGAIVLGLDRDRSRMEVGAAVASRYDLGVEFLAGPMQRLDLPDSAFDIAVQNNSLCYIVRREDRARALSEAWRVLRPGGWLLVHNPNRWTPVDQFTGLPAITFLPPSAATRVARALGRPRSRVRLASPLEAKRELRRAGFPHPRMIAPPARPWTSFLRALARYQHLVAQRPPAEADADRGSDRSER
jgi:SAM-dependent methyltransferase